MKVIKTNHRKIKKILIFGGSFDPPHAGHFGLLKSASIQLNPEIIYVVPVRQSPFKWVQFSSFHDRKEMLKLGFSVFPSAIGRKIHVHPFEELRKKTTYTWEVLNYFSKKHKHSKIYFLMGSDCLMEFHGWKNYNKILKTAFIVVGKRSSIKVTPPPAYLPKGIPRFRGTQAGGGVKNKLDFKYIPLTGSFPDISSTVVRKEILCGKIPGGVPESIINYILKKKLYFENIRIWLRKNLTKNRFKHTMSTINLAYHLALRYGVEPAKASLAALLHDLSRDFSNNKLIRYAVENKLKIPFKNETIYNCPDILHSYVSAHLAQTMFKIKNKEILNAVRFHTIGSMKMTMLDKIIYLADISSEDRGFADSRRVQKLAFSDIEKAFLLANHLKLKYILKEKKYLHPYGIKLWNRLIQRKKKN
jgi:nicotinate-nucleotide adenylyltransferase